MSIQQFLYSLFVVEIYQRDLFSGIMKSLIILGLRYAFDIYGAKNVSFGLSVFHVKPVNRPPV